MEPIYKTDLVTLAEMHYHTSWKFVSRIIFSTTLRVAGNNVSEITYFNVSEITYFVKWDIKVKSKQSQELQRYA